MVSASVAMSRVMWGDSSPIVEISRVELRVSWVDVVCKKRGEKVSWIHLPIRLLVVR